MRYVDDVEEDLRKSMSGGDDGILGRIQMFREALFKETMVLHGL